MFSMDDLTSVTDYDDDEMNLLSRLYNLTACYMDMWVLLTMYVSKEKDFKSQVGFVFVYD